MSDKKTTVDTAPPGGRAACADRPPADTRRSLSMHDGVEVWEDCCSCEAEPYWLAAFEETPDD